LFVNKKHVYENKSIVLENIYSADKSIGVGGTESVCKNALCLSILTSIGNVHFFLKLENL
jgi:hypothetical protein